MARDRVDVVVLGMGPGGEAVAGDLAEAGLSVVGVEGRLLGGECPYWGCIPSKIMVRAADALAEARRLSELAGSAEVHPDWSPVVRRVREATDDWDDRAAVERFESKGGRFVRGWGRLDGPDAVVVGDQRFEASRAVVVATGAGAWAPPVPGLADVPYWTNRDAIEATQLPTSLVVLGGGAIGVELAQMFARFGVAVRLVEGAPRLVAGEEPESSELVAEVLADDGVALHAGVTVTGASAGADGVELALEGGPVVSGATLLVATGRRPDLAAIGADTIGVTDAKALPVDERLRVCPGVWAVGDVTGVGAFTHVATYQARLAVADILGHPAEPADYRALPHVTFTDPEIGSVGETEQHARDRGAEVRCAVADLAASSRGFIHGPGNRGFIKLVEDAERETLIGATSAGPSGGEVLGLLALAVHAAVPTERLRQMIYAYPTFHRAVEDALSRLAATSG